MGGIFICYRREDSQGSAGRLYDGLQERFGSDLVFRDIDAIEAGVDYVVEIERTIGECDALVAVIGRNWLEVRNKAGARRLEDPDDPVRMEIVTALRERKPVIPVLIEDVVMPSKDDLPADLQALATRTALPISDLRWDYDMGRLVTRLEQLVPSAAPRVVLAKPVTAPRPDTAANALKARALPLAGALVAGVVLLLVLQKVVLSGDDPAPNAGGPGTSVPASAPDAAGLPSMALAGNAERENDVVRLTSDAGDQTGAVWTPTRIPVGDGFRVEFTFRIERSYEKGADGIAFVLHNDPNQRPIGKYLGYGGIQKNVAVEFDTWQNPTRDGFAVDDLSDNYVAVQVNGPKGVPLGASAKIPPLGDSRVHTATISYSGGQLEACVDGQRSCLRVPVDIAGTIGATTAVVGVTASTGDEGVAQTHRILSFTYSRQ